MARDGVSCRILDLPIVKLLFLICIECIPVCPHRSHVCENHGVCMLSTKSWGLSKLPDGKPISSEDFSRGFPCWGLSKLTDGKQISSEDFSRGFPVGASASCQMVSQSVVKTLAGVSLLGPQQAARW